MTGTALVEARNLSLGYGSERVVDSVSFSIMAGEYVCLIGRNGSGKSTLLRGILGLRAPLTGSVTVTGGPNAIAFMPQNLPGSRDFPATVNEVVLSGCQTPARLSPRYTDADRERAKQAMVWLDILDLAGKRLSKLSGGQRQRVFLARSLCREPKLLLLDEPFTGLDPQSMTSLAAILERFRRERNIAILMSSHDLGAVASSASRVLVLDRSLLFDGQVEDWLARFNSARMQACTR